MNETNLPISGEIPYSKTKSLIEEPILSVDAKQLKQLQQDIELLDHKIKAHVNHLRYTRRWKTRAIKKSITREFGKQINEIDARSNELEIKQKEQVQPSTDPGNENIQGQTANPGTSL